MNEKARFALSTRFVPPPQRESGRSAAAATPSERCTWLGLGPGLGLGLGLELGLGLGFALGALHFGALQCLRP